MALMPRGHLTAIRRMAKELNDWVQTRPVFARWFWMSEPGRDWRGWLFTHAREHKGQLQVCGADVWIEVDLSTARFMDRKGNDLMAIQ